MAGLALALQLFPTPFAAPFTDDAATLARATEYLQIAAWAMLLGGTNLVFSSFFQALGNTVPSLVANAVRLAAFAGAGVVLTHQPGFELPELWRLSVAATALQTVLSGVFLYLLFTRWASSPDEPGLVPG